MDSIMQNKPRGNGNTYRMRVLSKPDIIQAGKQVVFSFTPQIVGKETEPVPLDVDHGYEMHLIMISNDLSWFELRHPGLSDLGTYEQNFSFEKGGVYNLFAEYKPTGSIDTVQVKTIGVNGGSVKSVTFSEPRLTSMALPYSVILSPGEGGKFESGKMQTILAAITKNGEVIDPNTLGDYLGGKGHMVIINIYDKAFLHVYPVVENGNLVFHTMFAKPGLYRAWLQFQTDNIVRTSDFVIQVEETIEKSNE
ncbi:MAG: hypothetical protein IPP15_23985 [Saprospiraceae bacterium]|uniref:Uncharacterized protein n=1 Tax=Candidatus Opimibacter skivensis TaxID=2982028 RepID=A0A9D7XW65_9BACT|nr:hypothetical protein [Candidatus Opimibacter skivensis]